MPADAGIFVGPCRPAPSMSLLLNASDLHRAFGPHHAVRGVSLSLKRGEVVGLLGPNGAGKTTTLRMLTGCLAPDRGHIRIDGHDMADTPASAKARLGYLPEVPPLHGELTVTEYLQFAAQLHGMGRHQADAAVMRATQACGLEQARRQVIGSMSKGYRQRVGLAQAIIHAPPLIVLDEPTDGLDPNQRRQIHSLIRALARDHAILLSSHILAEIQVVCDRVAIMARGQVVYTSALDQLRPIDGDAAEQHVIIGLTRAPSREQLLALDGVTAVEALNAEKFRLSLDGHADTREHIARTAVTQDWGLFEMKQQHAALEQIFAELTA